MEMAVAVSAFVGDGQPATLLYISKEERPSKRLRRNRSTTAIMLYAMQTISKYTLGTISECKYNSHNYGATTGSGPEQCACMELIELTITQRAKDVIAELGRARMQLITGRTRVIRDVESNMARAATRMTSGTHL